jgi:YegS/Rv2252/BmrU family lipid kinase
VKQLLLIYNPVSGKGSFKEMLDLFIEEMQNEGFLLQIHRLSKDDDLPKVLERYSAFNIDLIVAAGGDGTISAVVGGMIYHSIDIPLGILPVGTINDFASYLNIDENLHAAINTIKRNNVSEVDVGCINGKSFVNVVSIGKLSSIAHKTNQAIKNNLGKMGYYINVLGQNPAFEFFKVKYIVNQKVYEEEAMLFLVLNTKGAGGFKNLAPDARVNDKKFDVLVIKNCNIISKLNLFLKILRGDHRDDSCIHYFQTDQLYVECFDNVETDVDGEAGPLFPMIIRYQRQIKVLC